MALEPRPPAVAGQFYPGSRRETEAALRRLLAGAVAGERVAGALVPHAGWVYSGPVAAEAYRRIEIPATVVILGPDHSGGSVPFAVWDGGPWESPLGEAAVDDALREAILARAPGARRDGAAHAGEHSIEVQVPFLLARRPDARIVPVALSHAPLDALLAFGAGLAEAIRSTGGGALVLVSSDLDHYRPHDETLRIDAPAVERLGALDPEGLHRAVRDQGIRMCGLHPAVAGLAALKALGATRGELLAHRTSHDAGGDAARTVGYAAVLFR